MQSLTGPVLVCLRVLRIPSRRSLAVAACCFILAVYLLFNRKTGYSASNQPNPTVYSSSRENAFYRVSENTPGLGEFVLETSRDPEFTPFNPYPDYNSNSWKAEWGGNYQSCIGPDGSLLDISNKERFMKVFNWNEAEFPAPAFGSHEAWNLNQSICADRHSRFSAYGFAEEAANGEQLDTPNNTLWKNANWGRLQQDCLHRNSNRYRPSKIREKSPTLHKSSNSGTTQEGPAKDEENNRNDTSNLKPRTAVVLRSWLHREYTDDDLHYIRSMIVELSLLSGAEYEVILMVDAQDTELPNPSDLEGLNELKNTLPAELQDLAVFFNSRILEDWYSKIDIHVAILQYFQPIQIFSRLNPQYEFFWQFEMDSRYTGHFYPFLEQAAAFARNQPRKDLWERNSYFYIPKVHGTWDDFVDQVDQSMNGRDSIWGPQPAKGVNVEGKAPVPPSSNMADDESWNWGVGEEADVITWLPQFNPRHTRWPFQDRVYNFRQKGRTPRRASVVAMSRVSARLLELMHSDKVEKGFGLASEMSPSTWALFYGLKSVYVPHPIYHAHNTNAESLNRRANSGKPGAISAGSNSIWNWGQNDDIMMKLSYMFGSEFSERLYRAWLGYDDTNKVRINQKYPDPRLSKRGIKA